MRINLYEWSIRITNVLKTMDGNDTISDGNEFGSRDLVSSFDLIFFWLIFFWFKSV